MHSSKKSSTVPFGFAEVTPHEKTAKVKDVFNRVASRYDIMNDLMSGGIHRLWKQHMINAIYTRPRMHLLDVAGGTGDIALHFLNSSPNSSVTVCDINDEMLNIGRQRAAKQDLNYCSEWICGDASKLPFPNNNFDAYTIAFGLRNITDMQATLSEAYRVLKPGSQFVCLEFSKVVLPILDKLYQQYSFKIVPLIGQLVAKDKPAYQYLVESIARFPDQITLEHMVEQAGFKQVKHHNLTGGVVALHTGWKI